MKENSSNTIWTKDFILLCFVNFFIFAGFQMTLPVLPLFLNDLGGNEQLIGLIVGIFTFSALIIRPISGHLLESLGRKWVYILGLLIFVISVGSYIWITSILLLFLMRIVQGLGWGMSTTAGGTIATDIIPAKRRGEGMGYFGLSGNLAMAFGPALGLLLVKVFNFPITFFVAAFGGFLAFVIAYFIKYKPVDTKSSVHHEKRFDIFEKSALRPALLLFFITMTFGGITTFLPLYANQEGISGIEWYFTIFALALMISRPVSGKIYDQKGHKLVFIPGAILIMIAMVILVYMDNSWMLVSAAFFFGFGFGSIQPALQSWAVQEAPLNRRGMANATFYSSFDLGVGFGAIFFGVIADKIGYSEIYIASAISVLIAILLYGVMWIKKADATFS
ncbi:MFS transporter [Saliterribacillus persicus]|uniref:Putative MFS family arabinose efflux permease n=1 Tax=Saliterribacillus persicus TaxID=930114 RepID=A0A368XCJ5_9BACI|nr:MFS transporter [Saliterribacillus persicus]RCW63754.1 putative MFS family arabinose efflux permease [Saliterribacillus persicus]